MELLACGIPDDSIAGNSWGRNYMDGLVAVAYRGPSLASITAKKKGHEDVLVALIRLRSVLGPGEKVRRSPYLNYEQL